MNSISSLQFDVSVLKNKFAEEQQYISKYVEFLHYKTSVFSSELNNLVSLIESHDIGKIQDERETKLWNKPYTYEELQLLNNKLQSLSSTLQEKIAQAENDVNPSDKPLNLNSVDARSHQGELIDFFLNSFEYDYSPVEIDRVRRDVQENVELVERETGEKNSYSSEMVEYAIKSAIWLKKLGRLSELHCIEDEIAGLDLLVRVSSPEAEINVLRQGFIVLMTVFDATIFDLVRIALKKDFFKLISVFGKQDKIALREFNNYSSFEEFSNEIIETQLKSKYLKDLLFILNHLGVNCVDLHTSDSFIQIIEMAQRRNIHIHNRGRVDDKYLEKDETGKSKFNIYNLALNDTAEIDKNYFEMAIRLSANCVNNIANWVDTIA